MTQGWWICNVFAFICSWSYASHKCTPPELNTKPIHHVSMVWCLKVGRNIHLLEVCVVPYAGLQLQYHLMDVCVVLHMKILPVLFLWSFCSQHNVTTGQKPKHSKCKQQPTGHTDGGICSESNECWGERGPLKKAVWNMAAGLYMWGKIWFL